CLRFFADYYAIPYPDAKMDMVGLPDFAQGAMENLGCVTFRETALLVDPAKVTQQELQRVTDVINHELAHMWFGDLVTMRWWNGIWLNEAFATFMEMKCTDAYRPEWQRWTDFGLSRSAAMDIDSLKATRPIEYEVRSPADAEGMFDLLTYEKGAAVVHMLEQYLGEDRFRDGIRSYLTKHAYANTETHDLWDALEDATGEPVRRMMDTWIFQGGHPVVRVEPDGTVSQRRFRYLDPDGTDQAHWVVPLRIRVGDREVRTLLDGASSRVELPSGRLHTANVDGTGFYRVRLSDQHLAELAETGPQGLSPVERYGLVDDTWALVLAGDVTVEQYCALLRGMQHDDDLSVWQRILGTLDSLGRASAPDDLAAYRRWVLSLLAPARDRLGDEPRPDEPERTSQLRGALLHAAGVLGHDPDVIARARQIVEQPDSHPAIVAAAIDIVAAHGTADDHRRYTERMTAAASPQEEERYRGALADFPGEAELQRTLAMTLDGGIRTQDAPFVVRRALRNHTQGPLAWSFLEARWDEITAAIPSNLVARMLEGITALAEPDHAARIEAFLDAHPVPQGRTLIEQHRERLRVHTAFRQCVRPLLGSVFS
ncbi:MAG TPA: M1 family aminopeptidase, partial [Acidimicrobiales bacterium]